LERSQQLWKLIGLGFNTRLKKSAKKKQQHTMQSLHLYLPRAERKLSNHSLKAALNHGRVALANHSKAGAAKGKTVEPNIA